MPTTTQPQLAIYGGPAAKRTPPLPMFPGGMLLGAEEEAAVVDVIRSKRLFRYYGPADGPSRTAEFEAAFARRMNVAYARAVNSGTSALICALVGAGIEPGDEVIVPAYTWVASAAAVMAVGAIPVLAEVDESLTLDPEDVRRKVSPRTRAIMPVHMRGAPANMAALRDAAPECVLIEDVAQAAGGSFQGQSLGTIGEIGAFSLQFNKIITTGEGGVITSNNRTMWLRALAFHDPVTQGMGRDALDPAEIPLLAGQNLRASEFIGAIGLVQLGRLDGLLAAMRAHKRRLREGLRDRAGLTLRLLHDHAGDTAICEIMFLPTAEHACRVATALTAENVPAMVLFRPDQPDFHIYPFWHAVLRYLEKHRQLTAGGPYRTETSGADMCPRTLDLLSRAVHIDVNPLLSDEDVEQTVAAIHKVAAALLSV